MPATAIHISCDGQSRLLASSYTPLTHPGSYLSRILRTTLDFHLPSQLVVRMAPPLPTVAKLKLSYPLYGADFDPLSSSFLIVGGGGGEGKHGVGNKIVGCFYLSLLLSSRLCSVVLTRYFTTRRNLGARRDRPVERRGLSHLACRSWIDRRFHHSLCGCQQF